MEVHGRFKYQIVLPLHKEKLTDLFILLLNFKGLPVRR